MRPLASSHPEVLGMSSMAPRYGVVVRANELLPRPVVLTEIAAVRGRTVTHIVIRDAAVVW